MSPKLCCDISWVLHEVPISFIYNNIKDLVILPYMTDNHTEKPILSYDLAMIHRA